MSIRKLYHSQNFLIKENLIKELINKSNINNNDLVLEIGAGKGIITKELINKCHKVYGIEYDFYLYKTLKKSFIKQNNVKIIYENFLKFEVPWENYKVFSNIPFNMTAEIINKLTASEKVPTNSYLIVQQEVAEKYAGKPYNKESMRSLLLKPFYELEIIHKFKNYDFRPIPNVNIVMIHISKLKIPLIKINKIDIYRDFITYIFCQHGSLKERCQKIFSKRQFKILSTNIKFDYSCGILDLDFKQWQLMFDYFVDFVFMNKGHFINGEYEKYIIKQKRLVKIHKNTRK